MLFCLNFGDNAVSKKRRSFGVLCKLIKFNLLFVQKGRVFNAILSRYFTPKIY